MTTKITPESEASFVISMIKRDITNDWTHIQKIEYFGLITEFLVDAGIEYITSNKDKSKGSMIPDMVTVLNELIREEYDARYGVRSKTPLEFIDDSSCLTDEEVQDWFKTKGIGPYSFKHIHVYEDRWFMVVTDESDDVLTCKCTWKDDKGNLHQNTMIEITKLIFNMVYLPSLEKTDV